MRKIFCIGRQDDELFVIRDGDDIGPYSDNNAPDIAIVFFDADGNSFTICVDGDTLDFGECDCSTLVNCDFELFDEYQNLEPGEHNVEVRVAFYDGEIQTMCFSFELCAQDSI